MNAPQPAPASESRDKTPRRLRSVFAQRHKWKKSAPLRGFYNALLWLMFSVLTRLRIHHIERMPKATQGSNGVIVVINHVHAIDPGAVLPWFGRPLTPLAKVEAFETIGAFLWVVPYGCIPVHRGEVDVQAIRAASEVLAAGGAIVISPEGTRSPTGALIRGQHGLAYLAYRTQATIVPVGIVGTTNVLPALRRLRRAPVDIIVGEPFKLQFASKPSKEDLQRKTDEAMYRLAALLPAEMRGVYGE
jgi:1-acyl-sn-glycerol-3-phosphate acyltransferase